jgi:hypothetical protein
VLVPVSAAALEDAILASVAEVGGRCKLETTSGLRFRDEADLPYGVEVEAWPSEDWTHASAEDTAAAFGFRPDREVVLIAFVNDGTSHRLLGQLAVDLATKTGGWIDLGAHSHPQATPAATCQSRRFTSSFVGSGCRAGFNRSGTRSMLSAVGSRM